MVKPAFNPLRDLLSGCIMAATSVPQLIAYAETVGYAGYRGLATAGPPLLAWGLATGSPYMNSGVTSMTALMCKSDLDGESYVQKHGEEKYVRLVAAYALYVGLASIFLALCGFAKLASRTPKPVRSGFKWGSTVAVLLSALPNGIWGAGAKQLKTIVSESSEWSSLVSQVKRQFPFAAGGVNVLNMVYGLSHPQTWTVLPVILFVAGTAIVMKGPKFLPAAAPPGTEVILVTALATWYSANYEYDGGVVGEIPEIKGGIEIAGMSLPVAFLDVSEVLNAPVAEQMGGMPLLLLSATVFAAINFLSIMGIASTFEAENGISWSAPRELIAQGVSCIVAAMVGSAPVSGSMSRSLVSRMTGTTSQLACMLTAMAWITLLPYMNVMSNTPKAVLSSVIVSAVLKGVFFPKDLIKLGGVDALVGWCTGAVTALTSPTMGFAFGLVFFVATIVLRSSTSENKKKTQ